MNLSHKLRFLILLFALTAIGSKTVKAQTLNNVGIGTVTPNPSSILELSANDKGFLAPRMTTVNRLAIQNPARGLWVYDIDFDQFWFYNGVIWVLADGTQNAWSLTGNSNTNPAVNFLGTTDAKDFLFKTGGNIAGFERMRITSVGQIIVNNTTPKVGEVFSVYASGTIGAINSIGNFAICGYSGLTGVGVFGENSGNGTGIYGKSISNGQGVLGTNDNIGDGVWGENGGTGVGVRGQSVTTGVGVFGSNDANGVGVYGYNSSTGNGLVGVNASMNPSAGYGIYAQASYNTSFGLYSVNTNFNGTAIIGVGNNSLAAYLTTGSGGAFVGNTAGLFAIGQNNNDGTGLLAVANNLATYGSLTGGAGVASNAYNIGVYGIGRSFGTSTISRAGGYFVNGTGGGAAYSYVGMFDGIVNRKIVGNGTVNTIINDISNSPVLMSAPEAPENLFTDYGSGKLVNGKIHITIDPVFSKNIEVSENHPLRVFIQLEGDCKGVYITNKTTYGFDVIELDGGASNASFMWNVVANRANETREDGFILKYADERFSKAPKPLTEQTLDGSKVEKPLFKTGTVEIKKLNIVK